MLKHYHRHVVLIVIYLPCHCESFHPLLLLFLFDWLIKRQESTKILSINFNGFYLLHHASGQMHVNVIIREPAVKIINKCNVNIAVCWLKLQTTSHGDFMYVFGCYLPALKLLSSMWNVRSFSPCTDSSHKLWDLQHFMFEQSDLHLFKAVISDLQLLLCGDIIVEST